MTVDAEKLIWTLPVLMMVGWGIVVWADWRSRRKLP